MSTQKDYLPRTGPDFLASNYGRIRTARAKYSFATDGGVIGLITPKVNEIIPDNAILLACYINSTTAVTSSLSATVSVGTSAGSAADGLLAATGKASFSADAIQVGVPVPATPVKMTAAGSITLTVAVGALTAGIVEIVVVYYKASA